MSGAGEPLRIRAVRALPGGITRSTVHVQPHPPYAVSGRGARVVDVNGHEVIDANNNYTSLIHGHAHPHLVEVANSTIRQGSAFGLPTPSEIALAETLASRTGIAQWRFCNSGTEAVMMALRCARAFTGRNLIVRFAGSYHGTYDGVVDPDVPGVPADVRHSVLVLPQGSSDAFLEAMRQHGSRVAAVLIDLMPNRAGLRPAEASFVELVRRETRAHGSLLVVDEVITFRVGFGGMAALYGLVPDIVVVGKVIGGGFAAGGIGGSADVLRPFDPNNSSGLPWGGTFSANPVTMSVGRAALELFDDKAILRLNAAGDQLRAELNRAGVPASGLGSLIRLRLDGPSSWWRLYEARLLVCTNGLLALSTAMSDTDIEDIARVIVNTIASGSRGAQ